MVKAPPFSKSSGRIPIILHDALANEDTTSDLLLWGAVNWWTVNKLCTSKGNRYLGSHDRLFCFEIETTWNVRGQNHHSE